MALLIEAHYCRSCDTVEASCPCCGGRMREAFREADNCGTGDGGFKPGNTCGKGDGGGGASAEVKAWAEKKFTDPEKAKAFTEWFGDSRIVDEKGKPQVVYHGTQADFDTFDQDHERSVSSDDQGYFFTTDPDEASAHAMHDWGRGEPQSNVLPVYLSIKNPAVVDNIGEPARWYDTYGPREVERAMRGGHDGLIVQNGEQKLCVVFSARQIKSAIGNRGTFNPNKPKITEAFA